MERMHARELRIISENAGKPWIRQSFFRQCFKITISPKIFTAKVLFYTVYVRLDSLLLIGTLL